MTLNVAMLGAVAFAHAAAGPALAGPTRIGDVFAQSVTTTTITTIGSYSPAANTPIIVAVADRAAIAATPEHLTCTAGFATVAAFTRIAYLQYAPAGGNSGRISLWAAMSSASPGTGTVEVTTSGNTFQQTIAVYEWVGASLTPAAILSATADTGTDISGNFNATPGAGMAGLIVFHQAGTGGTPVLADAAFTSSEGLANASGRRDDAWYAPPGTIATAQSVTGGQNGSNKILLGIVMEAA